MELFSNIAFFAWFSRSAKKVKPEEKKAKESSVTNGRRKKRKNLNADDEEEEEMEDCSANPKCLKPTGKEVTNKF